MPSAPIRTLSLLFAGAVCAVAPAVGQAAAPDPATTSAGASVPEAPAPEAPAWLVADPSVRTVTIALQVTPDQGGGSALINGHRGGEVQIVVPLDWTVQWDWRSADSTAPHSLVVMGEREKIPIEGGRPAFTNAMTRMVTAGLRPGQGDRTSFTADQGGWYWLLCGVPEHALRGEYLGLRVDPEARTAFVKAK